MMYSANSYHPPIQKFIVEDQPEQQKRYHSAPVNHYHQGEYLSIPYYQYNEHNQHQRLDYSNHHQLPSNQFQDHSQFYHHHHNHHESPSTSIYTNNYQTNQEYHPFQQVSYEPPSINESSQQPNSNLTLQVMNERIPTRIPMPQPQQQHQQYNHQYLNINTTPTKHRKIKPITMANGNEKKKDIDRIRENLNDMVTINKQDEKKYTEPKTGKQKKTYKVKVKRRENNDPRPGKRHSSSEHKRKSSRRHHSRSKSPRRSFNRLNSIIRSSSKSPMGMERRRSSRSKNRRSHEYQSHSRNRESYDDYYDDMRGRVRGDDYEYYDPWNQREDVSPFDCIEANCREDPMYYMSRPCGFLTVNASESEDSQSTYYRGRSRVRPRKPISMSACDCTENIQIPPYILVIGSAIACISLL